MRNTARGKFVPKNPEKYQGMGDPTYRSSWELTFMMFCDNNPAVEHWASESVKIPYRDPLTGKNTVYVPDFLIVYLDRNQKQLNIVTFGPPYQKWNNTVTGSTPEIRVKWQQYLFKTCKDLGYNLADDIDNHYVLELLMHGKV
jgi:hypothetical protein